MPVDGAAGLGVKGHTVLCVPVNTLDNSDFPIVGPVVTDSPAIQISRCLE